MILRMIVNDNKPAIEFMADCANRIFVDYTII